MEKLSQSYFDILKPSSLEFGHISKINFTEKKRIAISTLVPNQKEVDPSVIAQKRKGNNLTMPYVLFYKGYNILIDGHHTTIAKKLNGQKYIMALTLTL